MLALALMFCLAGVVLGQETEPGVSPVQWDIFGYATSIGIVLKLLIEYLTEKTTIDNRLVMLIGYVGVGLLGWLGSRLFDISLIVALSAVSGGVGLGSIGNTARKANKPKE
jgi:hypothetical protein